MRSAKGRGELEMNSASEKVKPETRSETESDSLFAKAPLYSVDVCKT